MCLRDQPVRGRALLGLVAGLGLYLPGLWWMHEFTIPGYVLATPVEAGFLAAAAAIVPPGLSGAWALGPALASSEWARGHWPFGGVPLGGIALGQAGGPLAGTARVGTQLLIVAVVGIAGTALSSLIFANWPQRQARGGRPRAASWQRAWGPLGLVAGGALARRLDATVVAGIVEDAGSDHFLNAAVVWAPDGRVVGRYDKVHRVPFGEYIPLRSLIRHLADLSSVPRDERSGHGPGRLDTPVGRLAVVVSYEVFFGDRARSGIRAGGRLLLVPTNASSFKTSQVPGQEVAAARLRAIEGGRWVVQAAPTGYTAVVDQRGRIRARGPLGRAATVEGTVGLRTGRT